MTPKPTPHPQPFTPPLFIRDIDNISPDLIKIFINIFTEKMRRPHMLSKFECQEIALIIGRSCCFITSQSDRPLGTINYLSVQQKHHLCSKQHSKISY